MTASASIAFYTGTMIQWDGSVSTSVQLGFWEVGQEVTPSLLEVENTGGGPSELLEFEVAPSQEEPDRMLPEGEVEDLIPPLSANHDLVLKELWDNPDDDVYDGIS